MIDFFVQLEARAPERNIWRSYCIAAGQDIFGDWMVELTYGRIGAKGHTKTVMLPDEAETRRYVRHCLKRRKCAPKRLGVGYTIKNSWGALLDDESPVANA